MTVGRGIPGGSASWSSGFLPSTYSGTQFRSDGDPVLNVGNPAGIDQAAQRASIEAINDLNRLHQRDVRDCLARSLEMADQPIAALLKDLQQRGLLDETLVVWNSEFVFAAPGATCCRQLRGFANHAFYSNVQPARNWRRTSAMISRGTNLAKCSSLSLITAICLSSELLM